MLISTLGDQSLAIVEIMSVHNQFNLLLGTTALGTLLGSFEFGLDMLKDLVILFRHGEFLTFK